MKTYVIKDNSFTKGKELGYLIYYETSKKFYIEIKDGLTTDELPILLSSFLKQGYRSINSYWSYLWVSDRIVPKDRQNIASVLKAYKLDQYDEFGLLIANHGRCEQDDSYLEEKDSEEIFQVLGPRLLTKIDSAIPLSDNNLLVSFYDGSIKKCDIRKIVGKDKKFVPIFNDEKMFRRIEVLPGGYELVFCNNLYITDLELYSNGKDIGLNRDDFINIFKEEIINSKEGQEILGCSRQNINDLIKRQKLHPIKESEKNTLLLKSEILKRKWK